MRLDGSNVTDWQHTGVHPRYGVRLESATLAAHVYVQPHMIAATDAYAGRREAARAGGERVSPPAPPGATIAVGELDVSRIPQVSPFDSGTPAASLNETWNPTPQIQVSAPKLEFPGARATDPDTAHLAAASITDQARRDVHRQVLAILAEGPASDFDLAARTGLKQTSVGKRRGELRDMGLVTELDHNGVSDTGSACCRWTLTSAGWAAA